MPSEIDSTVQKFRQDYLKFVKNPDQKKARRLLSRLRKMSSDQLEEIGKGIEFGNRRIDVGAFTITKVKPGQESMLMEIVSKMRLIVAPYTKTGPESSITHSKKREGHRG